MKHNGPSRLENIDSTIGIKLYNSFMLHVSFNLVALTESKAFSEYRKKQAHPSGEVEAKLHSEDLNKYGYLSRTIINSVI